MRNGELGGTRRIDLDWIRVAAFMLLILYHVGMLYVPWDYHVKSAQPVPQLVPFMLALNPWRLALLFVVSGAATRFMAERRGPGELLGSRSWRLIPPLVFGMLVVVPPQSYFEVVEKSGYAGTFAAFYRDYYFAFGGEFCRAGRCLLLPTWNHLWFVAYLWVYTLVLAGVLAALPRVPERLEAALVWLLTGWRAFIGPVVLLAAYRLVLYPRFPQTHALVGDWYGHALYASFFLFGFLVVPNPEIRTRMIGWRWAAFLAAAAAYATFMAARLLPEAAATALGPLLSISRPIAYAGYQWFCIVAVLGFGARWLTRDAPVLRYLTAAIFPYFIIHQTAIVATAFALRDAGIPAALEGAIVIAATAAACVLTFEIVRRIAWLRPLFGLGATARASRPVPTRPCAGAA
jgi:glucan biosynthesis protein C